MRARATRAGASAADWRRSRRARCSQSSCARAIARAQDDWQVIERHTTSQAPAEAGAGAAAPAVAAGDGTVDACGETARPAGEPYKTIVAQLNDMWGTNFQVYESLNPGSPHARNGGCIFYNQKFLDTLFQQWMKIDDPDAVRPMLYAIFAHEIGHLAHGDFDPANENVPVKNKELAADQFAGLLARADWHSTPRFRSK